MEGTIAVLEGQERKVPEHIPQPRPCPGPWWEVGGCPGPQVPVGQQEHHPQDNTRLEIQEELSVFLWDLSAILCACLYSRRIWSTVYREENIGLDCELAFTSGILSEMGSACCKV
uniref:Uncharacterized protein n=1 Tax=Branchiostoma floridae TaxID=7739 RepID=C3Y7V7_BRAFL|eukprot:XP_002607602.1 hypothetical protein BRAFLDRAFT_71480 [Branchiostoma floridae]